MGLLRAIITTISAVLVVNFIYNNKYIKNIPIINTILGYFENKKIYVILFFIICIMILW